MKKDYGAEQQYGRVSSGKKNHDFSFSGLWDTAVSEPCYGP
jgi:hypothetical protein